MKKKWMLIGFQIVGIFLLLYCSIFLNDYFKPELRLEYDPFLLLFIINIPFFFIGFMLGINNLILQFPYIKQWRINIPILIFTILGMGFVLEYRFIFPYIPVVIAMLLLNDKTIATLNILIGYVFITHIIKVK